MKSGMLISLLLLIIHQAQGRGTTPTNSQQFMSHKTLEEKTDKDAVVEEVNSVWKSKHFSGRARKLMITSEMRTTATIAKNEKKKGENQSVKSGEQRAADDTYPGILDIAGMDYSQARRKPPIHN